MAPSCTLVFRRLGWCCTQQGACRACAAAKSYTHCLPVQVEFVDVPAGAKVGERIVVEGLVGSLCQT